MKTSGGSRVLKRELENRAGYRQELEAVSRRLEVVWNNYVGVKGVRFDAVRFTPSEATLAEIKLALGEQYEELINEQERIRAQLKHIDSILASMDPETRQAVEMIHCRPEGKRKSYEQVARKHHISASGLWKRVEKALEEYEKRMHAPE